MLKEFREGEVGGIIILLTDPCDVEARLVTLEDVVNGVAAPTAIRVAGAVGLLPGTLLLAVAEVIEVRALQRVLHQRVVDARAIVVEPDLFRRLALLEEKHVGLHAIGIEDAGGQAEDGVEVEVGEQLLADGLARASLEEHVVGQHNAGPAMAFEHDHDVLEEVELVIRGLSKGIVTVHCHAAGRTLAKGMIGQYHVGEDVQLTDERVAALDGTGMGVEAMQIHVHRGERHHERRIVVVDADIGRQGVSM